MKKSPAAPAAFLQAVVVLVGLAALVFMLWEPHLEGRNAHATLFQVYFKDPFLAFAYLGSIPFFTALRQAFKVLGLVRRDQASSPESLKALRIIKFSALLLVVFVAVGELFIMLNDTDDRAGGVFIGLVIASGSLVAAALAALFERLFTSPSDPRYR
jgi:hypothetical protein